MTKRFSIALAAAIAVLFAVSSASAADKTLDKASLLGAHKHLSHLTKKAPKKLYLRFPKAQLRNRLKNTKLYLRFPRK